MKTTGDMWGGCSTIWIPLLMTFFQSAAAKYPDPPLVIDRLEVWNASETSITVEAHMQCGNHCSPHSITWKYAEGHDPLVNWERYKMRSGVTGIHRTKIWDLKPGTMYHIEAFVASWERPKYPSESVSIVAHTCPERPQAVSSIKMEEWSETFHLISWQEPEMTCASTSYYVKFIGSKEKVNVLQNNCTSGGSYLGNATKHRCRNDQKYLCLIFIPPRDYEYNTEYSIEVRTTDSSGVCSEKTSIHYLFYNSPNTSILNTTYSGAPGSGSKNAFHWFETSSLLLYLLIYFNLL